LLILIWYSSAFIGTGALIMAAVYILQMQNPYLKSDNSSQVPEKNPDIIRLNQAYLIKAGKAIAVFILSMFVMLIFIVYKECGFLHFSINSCLAQF
jgi:hypothetical protein